MFDCGSYHECHCHPQIFPSKNILICGTKGCLVHFTKSLDSQIEHSLIISMLGECLCVINGYQRLYINTMFSSFAGHQLSELC